MDRRRSSLSLWVWWWLEEAVVCRERLGLGDCDDSDKSCDIFPKMSSLSGQHTSSLVPKLVLQGLVRRTGKGPRTGPDCNRFKRTNSPGPLNFFEKDRKRPRS